MTSLHRGRPMLAAAILASALVAFGGASATTAPAPLKKAADPAANLQGLYRPGRSVTQIRPPFRFDAPILGAALSASWDHAIANVFVGPKGVMRMALRFGGLKVVRAGDTSHPPFGRIAAGSVVFVAMPAGGGAYRFTSLSQGTQLVQTDGKLLPKFDAKSNVVAVKFGPSLGSDPKVAMSTWLSAGGTMRVDQLSVTAGKTSLTADGTLTISKAGLLSGSLKLRFSGLDALANLVDAVQPGTRSRVATGVAILDAFTVPVPTAHGFDRQTVLFFRDGHVSIGIVPIGRVGPLRF